MQYIILILIFPMGPGQSLQVQLKAAKERLEQ